MGIDLIQNIAANLTEHTDALGAYIGAGISLLGGIGVGIGQGIAASKAVEAVISLKTDPGSYISETERTFHIL